MESHLVLNCKSPNVQRTAYEPNAKCQAFFHPRIQLPFVWFRDRDLQGVFNLFEYASLQSLMYMFSNVHPAELLIRNTQVTQFVTIQSREPAGVVQRSKEALRRHTL